jgi:hypothetical protein
VTHQNVHPSDWKFNESVNFFDVSITLIAMVRSRNFVLTMGLKPARGCGGGG